ncbi:MAG: hypothetical protein K6B46_02340 [Opitutales bacterium]|nr:hypothetical protein [Opitutales bacterium]
MNAEILESINRSALTAGDLLGYSPEIVLGVLALLTLAIDAFFSRDNLKIGRTLGSCGMLFAILLSLMQVFGWESEWVGGGKPIFSVFSAILIACGFLALRLTASVERRAEFSGAITNCLIILATASASLLFKQDNLLGFFVLLETLTILLYALVASYRHSVASLEAGVKYLIAGAVSGGMLLFGIMLLYGFTALAGISDPLAYNSVITALAANPSDPMAIAGALFLIGGLMFKLGIFPMNLWIPDTYQGAPMHVTFLLATLSKATGLFAMLIFLSVFLPLYKSLFPVLLVVALISMIHANVTALGQQRVKRLIGLSGASHASYLMLAALAFMKYISPVFEGEAQEDIVLFMMLAAIILYMVFYVLSLYPVFAAMALVPAHKGGEQDLHIDDFAELSSRSPLLTTALTSGIASLAGIPPTIGFVTKLVLLWILFYVEMYIPAIIMLLCVGGSVYYYFAWVRKFYEKSDLPKLETAKPLFAGRVGLSVFSALTVLGCVIYVLVFSQIG